MVAVLQSAFLFLGHSDRFLIFPFVGKALPAIPDGEI
jgi:hypothetical protein